MVCVCSKRLTRYGLDAVNLLEGNTRNSEIKLTIQQYWLSWLKEAALSKSTLRYLDVTKCNFHNLHSTWDTIGSNPAETRKAIQKTRLLTGTYLLQSNQAAFNQHQVDATCPLCKTDPEDRRHMILQCSALSKIRDKYLPRCVNLIPEFYYVSCDENIKIILDCADAKCEWASLEAVSRSFIYSIHCKRNQLINCCGSWTKRREDTISWSSVAWW